MDQDTPQRSVSSEAVCPYLGLAEDPSTLLGFASVSNYCHRTRPASPAKLEHQRAFCLGLDHSRCPLLLQPEGKSMPGELRAAPAHLAGRKNAFGRILLYGLLIAAIGGIVFLSLHPAQPKPSSPAGLGSGTSTQKSTAAARKTSTITASPSETPIPATVTTSPPGNLTETVTSSITLTPSLRLDVKLGLGQAFIIHKIQKGESLELFERKYFTTIEAIKAVNLHIPSPLLVGAVVVIPAGLVDPQDLPPFEAYKVAGSKIRLDALAQKLSADPDRMAYYNDLDGSTLLLPGDWVLVPRLWPTATPSRTSAPTATPKP